MKKTTCLFLAMTVFVVMFASACGSSVAPATQTVPITVVITPTEVPPVETVVPTQKQPVLACISCAAPADISSEPTDTYCTKKIPYQNFNVEPGTTFEPLDPNGELKCVDSGTVKIVDGHGLNVWTCTGKQLWTYKLKITNPACSLRKLETNTDYCQVGLGYDAEQNCCAPIDSGSVIITVNMGACP